MRLALLFLSLLTLPAVIQAQNDPPGLTGYITRVGSPTDFDVNGVHVQLHKNTVLRRDHLGQVQSIEVPAPFLGQRADVWGDKDHKSGTMRTTRLLLFDVKPAKVSGTAIIDLAPGSPTLFRADGRTLDLTGITPVPRHGLPPGNVTVTGLAALHTNVWVDYSGMRRADGAIAIGKLDFAPNQMAPNEANLLKNTEYDPAAVSDDAHQNPLRTQFLGIDFKKIPPHKDPVLQARVDRVGQSLVPAFQKALAADDPTRIHFRFQLIDAENWHDALALPSGIILVPFQILERLPDDAELAAILADNMASILEKQVLRLIPTEKELVGANVLGTAASFISPIGALAGLATGIGSMSVQRNIVTQAEQQSGRVALCLMHDAGYDISKAPEAWWTLASKPGKDPHRNPPPPRALNLYVELGTTWHPTSPDPALIPRPTP